jgi:hypothetical protein
MKVPVVNIGSLGETAIHSEIIAEPVCEPMQFRMERVLPVLDRHRQSISSVCFVAGLFGFLTTSPMLQADSSMSSTR